MQKLARSKQSQWPALPQWSSKGFSFILPSYYSPFWELANGDAQTIIQS